MFEIERNPNEERKVDETVTRCSSVLHTFASVMVTSYLWIHEALFTMLKIVVERNISKSYFFKKIYVLNVFLKSDLEQVNKVVLMVAQKLGFESSLRFLEAYLDILYIKWTDLDNFPYHIFNCGSKVEFYGNYWNILAPFVMTYDKQALQIIAEFLRKSPNDLVEVSWVRFRNLKFLFD